MFSNAVGFENKIKSTFQILVGICFQTQLDLKHKVSKGTEKIKGDEIRSEVKGV